MKFFKQKLTHKLLVLLLLISSVPIICIGLWSYWSGKNALEKQFLNSFAGIAQAKAEGVKQYLYTELIRAEDFAADYIISQTIEKYHNAELSKDELSHQLNNILLAITNKAYADAEHGYQDTLVIDSDGQILASTHPENINSYQLEKEFLQQALKQPSFKDIYQNPVTHEYSFEAAAPILNNVTNEAVAILINRLSLKKLNNILHDSSIGLANTGRTYLVNKDGYMISNSRSKQDLILTQKVDSEPVRLYLEKKQTMSGTYLDYRNVLVVGLSEAKTLTDFYDLGWLLLIEMDEIEAHAAATKLSREIIVFGIVCVAISLIIGTIFGRSLSRPIKLAIHEFFTTSSELTVTTEEHERTSAQQAAAVSETSATMDELGRSAIHSISQAESGNDVAQKAVSDALEGAKAMQEMLASMEELSDRVNNIGAQISHLSEQTSQIGHVTEAVKDIANQTNLLALNAAVEATRAGEHGKGFTVVSQEIRKLAEQSKKSAGHISDLVDSIQKGTNATVLATEAGTQTAKMSEMQVKHAKQSFDTLSNSVNNIAEVLQQIALTAKQQSNATNQVVEAMNMINSGAQETANGISQSKQAIQNLNQNAEKLQEMV